METTHIDEFLEQKYDFVICGGGTAGLVLAARLSENPNIVVGVIEAGTNHLNDKLVDTPGLFYHMFNDDKYDWCYRSVPQPGNSNVVHHLPRGKTLGGSSAINYMIYVRGSKQDYDDWAELAGDSGWSSSVLNEYFRKSQTVEPFPEDQALEDRETFPISAEYHGTSGPIRTSFNETSMPLTNALIRGSDEVAGYDKKPKDPWSGDHLGFYDTMGTVYRNGPHRGKRSYAARGYFEPNRTRPNLKVLCDSLVSKILLEGDTATGVEFLHAGEPHVIHVKREVIVCGGAMNSPQILELSGIGHPDVLKAAGVECKVENRGVGNNYQDHLWFPLTYELTPGHYSNDALYEPEKMKVALEDLEHKQGGPLTNIASACGYLPVKKVTTPDELQEIVDLVRNTTPKSDFEKQQLQQIIAHLESDISANLHFIVIPATPDLKRGIPDQAKLYPPPASPDVPNGFTWALVLSYPASRGSVHIASSDPSKHPIIDPGYLAHPADKAVIAAGLRFLDNVSKNRHVEPMIAKQTNPPAHVDLQDLQQGIAATEKTVINAYHACGSCALGEVVDSRLKVKGVNGLRVCDASIFPNHISGNIVGTVYAVAERGADIIREDHGI